LAINSGARIELAERLQGLIDERIQLQHIQQIGLDEGHRILALVIELRLQQARFSR
jgi:hypothetical protein